MAKFNVSYAKALLDGFGILIIDEKHAKFLTISDGKIEEKDLVTTLPIYEDQAGYFKGTSGGGISDESNVAKEFRKRFYKEVLERVQDDFDLKGFVKLVILCPEEDISLIKKLLSKGLKDVLVGFKKGNYIKVSMNEVLEKVVGIVK